MNWCIICFNRALCQHTNIPVHQIIFQSSHNSCTLNNNSIPSSSSAVLPSIAGKNLNSNACLTRIRKRSFSPLPHKLRDKQNANLFNNSKQNDNNNSFDEFESAPHSDINLNLCRNDNTWDSFILNIRLEMNYFYDTYDWFWFQCEEWFDLWQNNVAMTYGHLVESVVETTDKKYFAQKVAIIHSFVQKVNPFQ